MGLVTKETKKSVRDYVNSLPDKQKVDVKILLKLIKEITGNSPKIWGGNNIFGYGKYKYTRKGGKEEFEWFNIGFAPRKDKITLYLTCDLRKEPLVKKLGPNKHGVGCLHIKNLESINLAILKKLIKKYHTKQWHSC
jgi:hypothetical protein